MKITIDIDSDFGDHIFYSSTDSIDDAIAALGSFERSMRCRETIEEEQEVKREKEEKWGDVTYSDL